MAIFRLCLSFFVIYIIINSPLAQSRRQRHGRHSHYSNLKDSLPRDLSGQSEDNLEYYRNSYEKHSQILDRFVEYEDSEARAPSFFRRYEHDLENREDFPADNLDAFSIKFIPRRKRHNKHDRTVSHQRMNEHGKSSNVRYNSDTIELHNSVNINFSVELEVKEAQNRSICNYTVESIPDTRGSRVPKDLEHVRCNHIGSKCQGTDPYCCMQTYRNIEVSYGNGDKETMKLYVGCVCALQVLGDTQQSPLSIND